MKKRKATPYLVISSAHLGMDKDILEVFSTVAKYYKAQVVHLGPLATDSEIKEYFKLEGKVKDLEIALNSLDYSEGDNYSRYESRYDKLHNDLEAAESMFETAGAVQSKRIATLRKTFGDSIKFVTTKELCLPDASVPFIFNGLELSEKLLLAPIPPTGMKTAGKPIQTRSINYLKALGGKSWIVAHPIPSIDCFARPGINQAYNFFTVGALRHSPFPLATKQQGEFSHMPAAVLVLMDSLNGEFHPKQLHIDYEKNRKPNPLNLKQKITPMVLDDGLVFIGSTVIEAKSADKATLSTDDHAPYEHPGTLGALRGLNVLHQPETFINCGDAADFTSICHHIKDELASREGLRLIHDISALRLLLSAQVNTPSIKRKVLIDSNHHEWLTSYIARHPELIEMLDWPSVAARTFPDWDVFIRNDRKRENDNIFMFGDYSLRHGDQETNIINAERMFGKYLCGHWHKYRSYKRAVNLGCGAKLSPTYLKGKQNDWQSQVTSLTKHNDVTACNPKIVLHDKKLQVSRFAYRDGIYEVAAHVLSHDKQKIYNKIAEDL
jgi:hypothetical protein